nr:hypothetical protein [Hydrogenibacillus schlegelii]
MRGMRLIGRFVIGAHQLEIAVAERSVYKGAVVRLLRIVMHAGAEKAAGYAHRRDRDLLLNLEHADHLHQAAEKNHLFVRIERGDGRQEEVGPRLSGFGLTPARLGQRPARRPPVGRRRFSFHPSFLNKGVDGLACRRAGQGQRLGDGARPDAFARMGVEEAQNLALCRSKTRFVRFLPGVMPKREADFVEADDDPLGDVEFIVRRHFPAPTSNLISTPNKSLPNAFILSIQTFCIQGRRGRPAVLRRAFAW